MLGWILSIEDVHPLLLQRGFLTSLCSDEEGRAKNISCKLAGRDSLDTSKSENNSKYPSPRFPHINTQFVSGWRELVIGFHSDTENRSAGA